MANPTTYFGWVMPNSADLVTDLPADFNVFGQGVDTSMQYLLGGTTGQVLSKTSATNMAFTWINNDQGDITGVTAGTGISGGGTSGTVTVTNSMATEITAAGDIIVGTGSGTFDNLPIGTTAQVLTADTTVSPYKVKWATPSSGGFTLLSTTALTGASVTVSSISQSYKHLFVVINGIYLNGVDDIGIRYNGDSGSNYSETMIRNIGNTLTGVNTAASNYWRLTVGSTSTSWDNLSTGSFWVLRYTDTTNIESVSSGKGFDGTNKAFYVTESRYNASAAVTSLTIRCTSQTFSAGTIYIYGVS